VAWALLTGDRTRYVETSEDKLLNKSKTPATPSSALEHVSRNWNHSLRDFFQPMIGWIIESAVRERDGYFSQAADLRDLEHRMRNWHRNEKCPDCGPWS